MNISWAWRSGVKKGMEDDMNDLYTIDGRNVEHCVGPRGR